MTKHRKVVCLRKGCSERFKIKDFIPNQTRCAKCGKKLYDFRVFMGVLMVFVILLGGFIVGGIFMYRYVTRPVPKVHIAVNTNNITMGTVSGDSIYEKGSLATISASPREGFCFVRWNDGNTDSIRHFVAEKDCEFEAQFAAKPDFVEITVDVCSSSKGMGEVEIEGDGPFEKGEIITISAKADKGYKFVSWNDGNADSIREVVADCDKEYIAQFEVCNMFVPEPNNKVDGNTIPPVTTPRVPEFKISVKSSNPDMGTVKGEGTYDSLASVAIEAIAYDGYRFVKWNDGNKDKLRKVIIVRDQTYLAKFEKMPSVVDSCKCIIQYSFGKYEGKCKNGIPEGHGIMYYNCHIQIAKYYAGMEYYAEQGDYFDGNWKNGDIYVGTLYDKNGVIKYENIKSKPRTRPYDLEKNEYIK